MKKFVCFMSCICLILCSTACTKEESKSENSSTTSVSSETADNASNLSAKFKSEDFPLPKYDKEPIYKNVYLSNNPATMGEGPTTPSFEEELEYIIEEGWTGFFKIEIIDILSTEDAEKLPGYSQDILSKHRTFYKVKIVYDYILDKELNDEIIMSILGTFENQDAGDPIKEIGDTFVSLIDKDYTAKPYIILYTRAFFNFDFYKINNKEIGFSRGVFRSNKITDLDLGLLKNEKNVITTTKNNPVKYKGKYILSDVVKVLKDEYKQRGILTDDSKDIKNKNN